MRNLLSKSGFSIVEATVVLGITAAAAAGLMGLMENQNKVGGRMEFVSAKEQLRSTLIAQFLSQPENCKCVFENATFDKVGVTPSITFANGEIGRRKFTTPGDCSTATVPMRLVSTNDYINNLKATSIRIKDIQDVSGMYLGMLSVRVETNKSISGSKEAQIDVPVVIATAADADATKWKINGCSLTGTAGGGGSTSCRLVYEIFEHNGCNGQASLRHSDWTDEGTPGQIKWTFRDSNILYSDPNAVGSPVATRNGRNYMTADVSCARVGIQCR